MVEKIILSGMGGQGIILLGTLMANCAMQEKKYVTLVPSYGAEMRGGISNSYVTISDHPIGSSLFSLADSAILMYQPSVDKFINNIKKNGLLIYNENMVSEKFIHQDLNIIALPSNTIAKEIGILKVMNIIMLGVWCKTKKIISYKTAMESIEKRFKEKGDKIVNLNKKAFESGYNYK